MPDRIRSPFVSEVAFSQDGTPRPIHIFRAGTFTSMDGHEHTYTADHIRSMVENFAAGRRKRPPITERHDWGRAVGRIARVWADDAAQNLYAQPAWNTEGKRLLSEEIYDGFSCEIDHDGESRTLIGGSLTNYPAVGGLEPVMLEAPPLIDAPTLDPPSGNPASRPMRVDMQPDNPKETRMSDQDIQVGAELEAPPLPPITAPAFSAADPAVTAQVNAVVAQMTAQFEEQRKLVLEQAQAQFQRQLAEMQAQQHIQSYAQNATTPTLQRQSALPIETAALTSFLSSLNASQRTTAQGLLDRILDAGLVSFEEVGSQGDGAPEQSAKEQFEAAVAAKTGMTRLAAMQAVGKEQPELYAAYQAESSRRGAVQIKKGVK